MPVSHPSVPYIVDFQGGPSNDGAAIILKICLSDGRKFSGALPAGTIGAVIGKIEDFVRQAAERVEQPEAMRAR
jgi:hypothetical protein